jgi:hypothetical protein
MSRNPICWLFFIHFSLRALLFESAANSYYTNSTDYSYNMNLIWSLLHSNQSGQENQIYAMYTVYVHLGWTPHPEFDSIWRIYRTVYSLTRTTELEKREERASKREKNRKKYPDISNGKSVTLKIFRVCGIIEDFFAFKRVRKLHMLKIEVTNSSIVDADSRILDDDCAYSFPFQHSRS